MYLIVDYVHTGICEKHESHDMISLGCKQMDYQ